MKYTVSTLSQKIFEQIEVKIMRSILAESLGIEQRACHLSPNNITPVD